MLTALGLAACALTACKKDGVTCGGVGFSGTTFSWTDCEDGITRDIRCEPRPASSSSPASPRAVYGCICSEAGVLGNRFETFEPASLIAGQGSTARATRYAVANKQCGWKVLPP
jgi:hypothetical protein